MISRTITISLLVVILSAAPLFTTGIGSENGRGAPDTDKAFGDFTGEILPVFYVSNSRESVSFYEKLGFRVSYYHNYDTGEHLAEWNKKTPPIYVEMKSGSQKFALHLIGENDTLEVDGTKHYFGVRDVGVHHTLVLRNGISASKIYDRPWMRLFYVQDPDGHVLFFFTRPEDSHGEAG